MELYKPSHHISSVKMTMTALLDNTSKHPSEKKRITYNLDRCIPYKPISNSDSGNFAIPYDTSYLFT